MSMNRRALLYAGSVVAVTGLAGCASVPTQYYRLAVVPGTVDSGPGPKIGIRSVDIPGYLNQNGIAKSGGNYEFSTYANDAWAEPLNGMLQDLTVQELAQRLPGSIVLGSGGSIASPTDVLVETNVLRFDPDGEGQINLVVQIALKSGHDYRPLIVQTFTNTATPSGPDVTATVATMSMLWAKLIDQLASLTVEQWANQTAGTALR